MKSLRDTDIPVETLKQLYRVMLTIRAFEDKIAAIYPEQEIRCPVHLCNGQEAIAAAVCIQLSKDDYIFGTHRSHGHCIAKGMDLKPMAAELYGKVTGCSRGRGGSMHLADPEHGIPGTSAIVGGSIPLAVGTALASVLRGEGRISAAFFGDGAVDQGIFHEALNFASLKKLPVVFICENNFYATNSPQHVRQPDVGIAERAPGYGIPGECLEGNDVLEVYDAAKRAVERARAGRGPTLLECRTYRTKAHVGPHSDIEGGCRPAAEYEEWTRRCPVDGYLKHLLKNSIISEEEVTGMTARIDRDIAEALDFAVKSPYPDPSDLLEHLS